MATDTAWMAARCHPWPGLGVTMTPSVSIGVRVCVCVCVSFDVCRVCCVLRVLCVCSSGPPY